MTLNFKQGLKSSLPLTNAAAGTVYLTTVGDAIIELCDLLGLT